ncbi:MAG: thermonuclease family protein [Candidatus Heimdallarchaeota archaeon]
MHDFNKFPELTNSQMQIYYFDSPHKQITENFQAEVVKIIDGDTIRVRWSERDFDFPIRLSKIQAPEMNEKGGKEARNWLEKRLSGAKVEIIPDKQRVGRRGRILGEIIHQGININEELLNIGHAVLFSERNQGKLPDLNKELSIKRWL